MSALQRRLQNYFPLGEDSIFREAEIFLFEVESQPFGKTKYYSAPPPKKKNLPWGIRGNMFLAFESAPLRDF